MTVAGEVMSVPDLPMTEVAFHHIQGELLEGRPVVVEGVALVPDHTVGVIWGCYRDQKFVADENFRLLSAESAQAALDAAVEYLDQADPRREPRSLVIMPAKWPVTVPSGGQDMEMVNGLLASRFCGMNLPLQVLQSGAGFYIGTADDLMSPVSRESAEYFRTKDEAEAALLSGAWTQRQSP